ncbi:MAG: M48 family metallopeptidase [Tannerellaceae bacterium]|jgi:predicted metal-dependent hydrolase|nr:M48 family metallopeptidase [Tannerellaceae bacterium]
MENTYYDSEFGAIPIRYSARAKHYSIKVSAGKLLAVIPTGRNALGIAKIIENNRAKLAQLLARPVKPQTIIDESTKTIANILDLNIYKEKRNAIRATTDGNILNVACPLNTNFTSGKVQEFLKKAIGEALRVKATKCLPTRVEELAKKNGFIFTSVTITKTHSRWGSCNIRKEIRLSGYLMLAPEHLRDYVILHELCHTIHLNHGEKFWALLDKVTGNLAFALRAELKRYTTHL